jgi:DNA repair protein RadC
MSITGTVVDIRIILGIALKSLATGIIIAHTHPSGELKPSKANIDLTQKLKVACKKMEITLLDHFIITTESYFSFKDDELL